MLKIQPVTQSNGFVRQYYAYFVPHPAFQVIKDCIHWSDTEPLSRFGIPCPKASTRTVFKKEPKNTFCHASDPQLAIERSFIFKGFDRLLGWRLPRWATPSSRRQLLHDLVGDLEV